MTGDDIAGYTFLAVLIGIVVLGFYSVFTDEYSVQEVSSCIESKITYRCSIQNGETLFFCDTSKECNKKCEEARNK